MSVHSAFFACILRQQHDLHGWIAPQSVFCVEEHVIHLEILCPNLDPSCIYAACLQWHCAQMPIQTTRAQEENTQEATIKVDETQGPESNQNTLRHMHDKKVAATTELTIKGMSTLRRPTSQPWRETVRKRAHTTLTLYKSHAQFPAGTSETRPPGDSKRAKRYRVQMYRMMGLPRCQHVSTLVGTKCDRGAYVPRAHVTCYCRAK
jgi:hypothetical protein